MTILRYFVIILFLSFINPAIKDSNANDFAFSNKKLINRQYYIEPSEIEVLLEKKYKEARKNGYFERVYFDVSHDMYEMLKISKGMHVGKIFRDKFTKLGPLKDIYLSSNDLFYGLFIEYEGDNKDIDQRPKRGLHFIYSPKNTTITTVKLEKVSDQKTVEEDKEKVLRIIMEKADYLRRAIAPDTEEQKSKMQFDDVLANSNRFYDYSVFKTNSISGMQKIIQVRQKTRGKYRHPEYVVAVFDDGEMIFVPDNTPVNRPNVRPFHYIFESYFEINGDFYMWLSWYASGTGYHGVDVYKINEKKFEKVFSDSSWST